MLLPHGLRKQCLLRGWPPLLEVVPVFGTRGVPREQFLVSVQLPVPTDAHHHVKVTVIGGLVDTKRQRTKHHRNPCAPRFATDLTQGMMNARQSM